MKKLITILICTFCFLEIWAQSELKLSQGLQWVSSGGVQIVLEDIRLEVNGDFMPGQSKVWIYGQSTPTQSVLDGDTNLNLYDLRLNHSGGGLLLEQNLNLSNKMTFSAGVLDLNGYDFNLGGSGILANESETSRIIGPSGGKVHAFAYHSAATKVNPGNLGLEINSDQSLDSIHISRGHEPLTVKGDSSGLTGSSISRYYEVSPPMDLMDATLGFYYFDEELMGLEESELNLGRYSADSAVWRSVGVPTGLINTTDNFLEKAHVDSSGLFTLAHISVLIGIENDPPLLNTWIVYPNPSSGEVVLEWELARTSDLKLSLVDLRGKTVYRKDLGSLNGAQKLRLDFSHLAEGIYNLMLEIDGNLYHRKLLIF